MSRHSSPSRNLLQGPQDSATWADPSLNHSPHPETPFQSPRRAAGGEESAGSSFLRADSVWLSEC